MRPGGIRYYRELKMFLDEMAAALNILARNQTRLCKLLNEVADGHGSTPIELEQFKQKKEKEPAWKKLLEHSRREQEP